MQIWLTEGVSFELVCLHAVFPSHMFCWSLVNCFHIQTVRDQFYAALPVSNFCSIHLILLFHLFIFQFPCSKNNRWLS